MILELAVLNVKAGQEQEFEVAFQRASAIIASMKGYRWHELQRCLETAGRYALLVEWENLEDHTIGFRGSPEYQEWKARLHPFYNTTLVEHYEQKLLNS